MQYILLISNITDYLICFDKKELIIRDDFFKFYPDVLSYLNVDALPQKTEYIRNEFTDENDVPIIYGTDEMLVNEHHIICGIDVFASSFFMLTR